MLRVTEMASERTGAGRGDPERERVRRRLRWQLGTAAAVFVVGGTLGYVLGARADGWRSPLAAFGATLGLAGLVVVVLAVSVSTNSRGAVRAPAVQRLPHPVRRRTMVEIQAFVRGGPPPSVDVVTARAVALAASESWWMVALPVGLLVYGIVWVVAVGPIGALVLLAAPFTLVLLARVVPVARAADAFLDRTDPAGPRR